MTDISGASSYRLTDRINSTTQVGSNFGVFSLSQDGFTSGQLSGIDIDEEGVVQARFTNGQSEAQGQVVLANFSNPQGLQPVSNTNWADTNASGAALVGAPGTASLGLLQSGAIEESNADLSEELVNMIVAQRAFQANAQLIRETIRDVMRRESLAPESFDKLTETERSMLGQVMRKKNGNGNGNS